MCRELERIGPIYLRNSTVSRDRSCQILRISLYFSLLSGNLARRLVSDGLGRQPASVAIFWHFRSPNISPQYPRLRRGLTGLAANCRRYFHVQWLFHRRSLRLRIFNIRNSWAETRFALRRDRFAHLACVLCVAHTVARPLEPMLPIEGPDTRVWWRKLRAKIVSAL